MKIKQIFKILNMHCSSCAMSIDGELEDVGGVKESNTNFAKALTEVIYDTEKIDAQKIIAVIKKAGYSATLN